MTRRPGYDIDGHPTKVDPRDFPDPLQVDPDGEPQRGEPPRPARGDWGCSVFAVAVLLVVVAGCSAQPAANATPSAAPENRMGDAAGRTLAGAAGAAQGQRGAPHQDPRSIGSNAWPVVVVRDGATTQPAVPFGVSESPAASSAGLASTPAPLTLAAVTYSGIVNYAKPSHGRWYLAIPDGKGVLVRICGPAGCLDRISTDAGPDLAMQRAGRIADLNSVDWEAISGVPLRFGGFQGTILILKRPAQIALPATSTKEGP